MREGFLVSSRERHRPWFRRRPRSTPVPDPLFVDRGQLILVLNDVEYPVFGPIRSMPEYFMCPAPTWRARVED
jgi:hypothetical protein